MENPLDHLRPKHLRAAFAAVAVAAVGYVLFPLFENAIDAIQNAGTPASQDTPSAPPTEPAVK